jgi:hypothetical protein
MMFYTVQENAYEVLYAYEVALIELFNRKSTIANPIDPTPSPSQRQSGNGFNMIGVGEHVNRLDFQEIVGSGHHGQVPGQRSRIA